MKKKGKKFKFPKINAKLLIICFVIVYLTALFGSLFTSQNTDSEWYLNNKPSITPPNSVFPIVWNILFILIAVSLYFAWSSAKNKKDKKKIALVFGANLLLNALWSLFFFGLQKPLIAFVDLILVWITILAMIFVVRKISKKSAWLLVPYLVWVGFAGVLNFLWI